MEGGRRMKNRENRWERYKVDIEPIDKDGITIERFTVSEHDTLIFNLRQMLHRTSDLSIIPGTYTRMKIDGVLVMSDTPGETGCFTGFLGKAEGHVLVHGLGLGCVVQALLLKKEVTKVTVIEIDQRVIDIIGPHLMKKFGWAGVGRLEIICDDCLTRKWPPGTRWDYVWHDIWNTICEDNWESMKKLHRSFGQRCKHQESWQHDMVRDMVHTSRYDRLNRYDRFLPMMR